MSPALDRRVRWALEHHATAKPADLAQLIRELADLLAAPEGPPVAQKTPLADKALSTRA